MEIRTYNNNNNNNQFLFPIRPGAVQWCRPCKPEALKPMASMVPALTATATYAFPESLKQTAQGLLGLPGTWKPMCQ